MEAFLLSNNINLHVNEFDNYILMFKKMRYITVLFTKYCPSLHNLINRTRIRMRFTPIIIVQGFVRNIIHHILLAYTRVLIRRIKRTIGDFPFSNVIQFFTRTFARSDQLYGTLRNRRSKLKSYLLNYINFFVLQK